MFKVFLSATNSNLGVTAKNKNVFKLEILKLVSTFVNPFGVCASTGSEMVDRLAVRGRERRLPDFSKSPTRVPQEARPVGWAALSRPLGFGMERQQFEIGQ